MDHFELVSEYAPTGDRTISKRLQGRQPVSDFTRSYGLWQDFYYGKCHCPVEQANIDFGAQ